MLPEDAAFTVMPTAKIEGQRHFVSGNGVAIAIVQWISNKTADIAAEQKRRHTAVMVIWRQSKRHGCCPFLLATLAKKYRKGQSGSSEAEFRKTLGRGWENRRYATESSGAAEESRCHLKKGFYRRGCREKQRNNK
jgi:hypothetical protein